jgi:hypothetical protein
MTETLSTQAPRAAAPRAKPPAPTTWPAFVVAIAVAGGLAGYYALRAPPLPFEVELGPTLWGIFNRSLVPTVVIALVVWCLLYFGFVRWKNGERGPLHFNTLLGVVFATLILAPFARQQVDLFKAGDVKGLQADTLKADTAQKIAETQAQAALTAAMAAAAADLELNAGVLDSASARKQAKARVAAARQASRDYQVDYADRAAQNRAAFLKRVASHKISPEISTNSVAAYDLRAEGFRQRAARDFDNQQALFDEVEGGIAALDRGLAKVDGYDLWFSPASATPWPITSTARTPRSIAIAWRGRSGSATSRSRDAEAPRVVIPKPLRGRPG